MDIISDSIINI